MSLTGLVDVDFLSRKSNFPNLALMKISAAEKLAGNETRLVTFFSDALECNKIYSSKVFTDSKEPDFLRFLPVPVLRGGSGYNLTNAAPLPENVEHIKPDYDLYAPESLGAAYRKKNNKLGSTFDPFLRASIGFTSRFCFRKCPFCVNRYQDKCRRWSPLAEFLEPSRPLVFLLDDNVLACPEWRDIFAELKESGKKIAFKQGLDVRLMTCDKARAIAALRYYKEVTFAFDNIDDKSSIENGLKIFRMHCDKPARAYVLVGFFGDGGAEILSMLDRVAILKNYDVLPYIMKHDKAKTSPFWPFFVDCARFYNQPRFSRSGNLVYFVGKYGSKKAREILWETNGLVREIKKRGL